MGGQGLPDVRGTRFPRSLAGGDGHDRRSYDHLRSGAALLPLPRGRSLPKLERETGALRHGQRQ
eukprot:13978736-Heterocapsa_arctica.AAC.1